MRGSCYYVAIGFHHQNSCQKFTYKFNFFNINDFIDRLHSVFDVLQQAGKCCINAYY